MSSSNGSDGQNSSPVEPKTREPEVIPGRSQFGTRYTKAYKLRILALAEKCTGPGEIGKMLRREGLMHCTLTSFRRQRAAGYLDLDMKRSDHTDKTKRVMDLERENRRLKRKLEQAEAIIEVQKKSLSPAGGVRRSRPEREQLMTRMREAVQPVADCPRAPLLRALGLSRASFYRCARAEAARTGCP